VAGGLARETQPVIEKTVGLGAYDPLQ